MQPLPQNLANGQQGLQGQGQAKHMGAQSRPQSAQNTPGQSHLVNPSQALNQGVGPGQTQAAHTLGKPTQVVPGAQVMQRVGLTQAAQAEVHNKIVRRNLGNAGVVRLLDLIDLVLNEPIETLQTIEFWSRLVSAYFVPTGLIRLTTSTSAGRKPTQGVADFLNGKSSNPRSFELDVASAPRFFLSNVTSQALASLQLFLSGAKSQALNNGLIFIGSKITINYNYLDGSMGTANGYCRILLNRDLRIDWVDCRMMHYQSSIGTSVLASHFQNYTTNVGHKAGGKDFVTHLTEKCHAAQTFADYGLHEKAVRTLQTGDVMTILGPLMAYSTSNNIASPLKAMEEFTSNPSSFMRVGTVADGANGSVSSPSPRTVTHDDPKQLLKKRRVLSAFESPMMTESQGN